MRPSNPFESQRSMARVTLSGVLDECIQAFLHSRVFDPLDILFNALAVAAGVGTAAMRLGTFLP